jgi:hypothetical protein
MPLPKVLVRLWTSGRLACVLVTRDGGLDTLAVQVWNGDQTVLSEPTTDPDDAARRGQELFAIFANNAACT